MAALRIGQVIGGRWTLERLLGTGAAAAVYAARGPQGKLAAVKLLHPEMSEREEVRSRFLREGSTASRVVHPGVVEVIEEGASDPESAYIVMELLEGEPLSERLKREGGLPLPELLDYTAQILEVLVVAHAEGVVHRDLKPGNLFITAQGRVKLLDFGVARLLDPALGADRTRAGITLGTVPYMAPEQALGKTQEIDGRTDLFALGAMMFRIISGRRVHESDNDSELLIAMASKPAPSLASVAPGTPAGVCAVVDLALGFSRDARYPDAKVMLEDVRGLLDDRPPAFAQRRITSSEQSTVMGGKGDALPQADGGVSRAPTIAAAPEADAPEPASESGDDEAAEALIGQVLADRYRVQALLGSGGMGSVYRAEHVHMRKDVAIKVLHREMTYLPEVVARFEREAVAAARIEHPNVAGAKDFGRLEDGSFYLVLEYVQGRSLRRVLDEGGALDAARALHIASQISSALAAAHAAGIVHRDLKPDNVMLVPRAGEPDRVKVLDFGIAKLSAEDTRDQPALTRVGSVFGTPEYMSPEQAVGQSVDARSDLYTVGILLYEMLEGRTPFAGDGGMVGVLTRQMTAEPPPLSPGVEPELARLVMTQLAKSREQRIQTADELVASLRQLEGKVTPSPPVAAADSRPSSLALGDTMLGGPLSVGAQPAVSVRGSLLPAGGDNALTAGPGQNLLATLRRSVQVGGQPIPIWALVATALVLLVVGVFVIGGVAIAAGGSSSGPSVLERAKEKLVRNPELEKEIKQAEGGDRAAIAKLEAKPASHRSAPVWRALGMGHTRSGDLSAAVRCYERALDQDSSLKKDPVVLDDLRKAAEDSRSSQAALELASGPLGSVGVDIIYDVATSSKVRKPLSQHAKELLDRESVRAKASPALKIALELRKTKKCSELKELLPRVQKEGDRRSLAKLKRLKSHRGCGFLGLGDCYSCLRRGKELSDAIDAVDARPGPFDN